MHKDDKDLFLDMTESDIESLAEAIVPLYQNSIIRWANRNAPNVTVEEMHERVLLFIGEVAVEAAKRYSESEADARERGEPFELHPKLREAITKSFQEGIQKTTGTDA